MDTKQSTPPLWPVDPNERLPDLTFPDVPRRMRIRTDYESTPESSITFYKGIPLDPSYNNTIAFNTLDAQETYFNTYSLKKVLNKTQYIRHSANVIKVKAKMSEIFTYNYMSFINTSSSDTAGFEEKNFYAFVTNVEYAGVNTCLVSYQIDVMQTFLFDFSFSTCFIERMHVPVSSDIPGNYRLDEGLPTGERMQYSKLPVDGAPYGSDYANVIFLADVDNVPAEPSGALAPTWSNTKPSGTGRYGVCSNVMSGVKIEAYKSPAACYSRLDAITLAGAADSVICVVQMPAGLFGPNTAVTPFSNEFRSTVPNVYTGTVLSNPFKYDTTTRAFLRELDGYTPNNNKLFTSPYFGLLCTSSSGESNTFAFEDFNLGDVGYDSLFNASFNFFNCISPTPSVSAVPRNYRGLTVDYEDEVECHDFPQCVYATDSYKAWVAQNGYSYVTAVRANETQYEAARLANIGSTAAGIAGGAANALGALLGSGNSGLFSQAPGAFGADNRRQLAGMGKYEAVGSTNTGGILSGIGGMLNNAFSGAINDAQLGINYGLTKQALEARKMDAKKLPDKSRGNAGSYMNYSRNTVGFMFYTYSIKNEYARMIDKYLDMFGYKVNKLGIPNIRTRPGWTYIKTTVCNLNNSFVPAVYEDKIKTIMNNGITFWRNPKFVGNYGVNNR
nr:MAG TPA: Major tail protein [Caudoviricetes sp.]